MPKAGSCSFVLGCDQSHLQIAHPSLTLVPRFLSLWKKGFCAALRVEVLRAHPGPAAGGLSARDQFADRAEVRVSQLLLSAHHPGRLLWWPALCRGLRSFHRVARLFSSGHAGNGDGSGAERGGDADVVSVGRLSDLDRICGWWAGRAACRPADGSEECLSGDAG